jgi:hypothetical protein
MRYLASAAMAALLLAGRCSTAISVRALVSMQRRRLQLSRLPKPKVAGSKPVLRFVSIALPKGRPGRCAGRRRRRSSYPSR